MKARFRVEGMDCASCAMKVEKAAGRTAGVTAVQVSVTAETLTVTHDGTADLDGLLRTVDSLGYRTARLEEPSPVDVTPAPPPACGCGHGVGGAHHHAHTHAPVAPAREGEAAAAQAGTVGQAAAVRGHDHPPRHAHAQTHAHAHSHEADDVPWWRSRKARLTGLSGAALLVAYGLGLALPSAASGAFLVALAVGLLPIARRAFVAARLGTPFSIEMLMTIAAVGAVLIGAEEEAAMVVFLFLVGELLEGFAAARARASIRGLARLLPRTARLRRGASLVEVPAETLAIGDEVLVRPGDRIPADGAVLEGESAVDEAPVTGESVPKAKAAGDPVFAGTVNGEGALAVRVTAAARDNTIARIVRLVEEAQESKAPTARFIDRFSFYYTPAVVLVAAAVAVLPPLLQVGPWSEWIYKGLAILLIGCPCALVISTPAAIAAGLSAGARRGLLMKGGAVLETVGRLTTVALDKTGTLTLGQPIVTDVVGFADTAPKTVLRLAAALEAGSSHPLARAILARAEREGVAVAPARDAAAVPGRGVEGVVDGARIFLGSAAAVKDHAPLSPMERSLVSTHAAAGKSVSVIVRNGSAVGLIALRDEPRPDARRGIEALQRAGVSAVMLTGDNQRTADAVAASVGIAARADLLPGDKLEAVRALQARGHRVGKVGDGINDAPALAAADVGIAMGGGTDVALETADAAILNGKVIDIANMIGLSRAVLSNIRQNIALALGLKAVFLVTTIAGITGLWPAILADTGATVLVTANAMRLLSWRGET